MSAAIPAGSLGASPVQADVVVSDLAVPIGRAVGYAALSAAATGAAAAAYRWYFGDRLPRGVGALVGVAVVTFAVNAVSLNRVVSGDTAGLFTLTNVLVDIGVFLVALAATSAGLRAGDAVVRDAFAYSGAHQLEGDVSRIVRSVGRVTAVTLPERIEDVPEHDPVPPATKEKMANKTLLFPRRLTAAELQDRLVVRLEEDYDVGYADVELDEDGNVEYLAVGGRQLGIGPTLPPGTAVVPVLADPSRDASPGDVVQVWTPPPSPERVLTAELRGTAGDVAAIAVDDDEADRVDPETTYRLVTLPAEPQADREFASMLRAADETMGAFTVRAGDALVGATVGDVEATVAAVTPADGPTEAVPPRSRRLEPGDTLYVIARPEALRRLETDTEAQPSTVAGGE